MKFTFMNRLQSPSTGGKVVNSDTCVGPTHHFLTEQRKDRMDYKLTGNVKVSTKEKDPDCVVNIVVLFHLNAYVYIKWSLIHNVDSPSAVTGGSGGWEGEEGWREGEGKGEREEEGGWAKLSATGEPGQSNAGSTQGPKHARDLPLPALQTGEQNPPCVCFQFNSVWDGWVQWTDVSFQLTVLDSYTSTFPACSLVHYVWTEGKH